MRINEENFVEKAERAIKVTKEKNGKNELTTAQLRNILAMAADIYNDVMNESDKKLSKEIMGRIEYLKIRLIYNVGREKPKKTMENFVNETELLDIISEIGDSKQNFIMFHRYMEALVAYHKYYGGKEQ